MKKAGLKLFLHPLKKSSPLSGRGNMFFRPIFRHGSAGNHNLL
jgi:hypothetical protein